jgi:transposase
MTTGVCRQTLIDGFVPYLRKRWGEGCVNAASLHAEIADRGFRGSLKTVRRYLQQWRIAGPPAETPPALTPWRVTSWIMRRAAELPEKERGQLRHLLERSVEIATTHRLATGFAHLLRHRRGERLESWAHEAESCAVREIRSFATTVRRYWDAVVAGLSLPQSNGPTEGNVNRLKLIKRAMFCRANFDLLRRRVLHPS